jgi:hypothetical protein
MVHRNIQIKDIKITLICINAKHGKEGKVGSYTILAHSTRIQVFLVISIYMGVGERHCSAG